MAVPTQAEAHLLGDDFVAPPLYRRVFLEVGLDEDAGILTADAFARGQAKIGEPVQDSEVEDLGPVPLLQSCKDAHMSKTTTSGRYCR